MIFVNAMKKKTLLYDAISFYLCM